MKENTEAETHLKVFEHLLENVRPKLHSYCTRIVGSTADAEDIVQDSMVKAISTWNDSDIRNPEAWLFRIAHNGAIDHLRRTTKFKWEPLEEAPEEEDGTTPAKQLEQKQIAILAVSIFMQLPPLQRCAVVLKDVFGYSLTEVASLLDSSTGSVKSALHRARGNLDELTDGFDTDHSALPLAPDDARRLQEYVDHFRSRDFDTVRSMLVADVTLELVGRVRKVGAAQVGRYFSNYESLDLTSVEAVLVGGRPALWVTEGELSYPIIVSFTASGVVSIIDFRCVPYLPNALLKSITKLKK